MYKEYWELNNLQGFIYNETQPYQILYINIYKNTLKFP